MTAPRLALAALLLASLAPAAAALPPPLPPPLGDGPGVHFVTVLVVDGVVRQIDLSVGLECLVDDDPDSDPAGTRLTFVCTPIDPAEDDCLSVQVDALQAGGGVRVTAFCDDGDVASCVARFPAGLCHDHDDGGEAPFTCSIFARHPVVLYRARCSATFA